MPSFGFAAFECQLIRPNVPVKQMDPLESVELCVPVNEEPVAPFAISNVPSLLNNSNRIGLVPSENDNVLLARW